MLTYENGIIIGIFNKKQKVIVSNEYGYVGYYWGYKSFRPTEIKSTSDLNDLKSRCIESGVKVNWSSFQWCLNNFNKLTDMD